MKEPRLRHPGLFLVRRGTVEVTPESGWLCGSATHSRSGTSALPLHCATETAVYKVRSLYEELQRLSSASVK